MLFHEYLLLSLFPSSCFIRVYFIISAFGVESIVHHSRSFLLLNKCTKAWKGHCDVAPRSLFNEESVVPAAGRTVGRQTSVASLFRDCPAARVPCPRSCPFLGGPHSMSDQCKNVKSWPPWPNTEWHFSSRVPCGVS